MKFTRKRFNLLCLLIVIFTASQHGAEARGGGRGGGGRGGSRGSGRSGSRSRGGSGSSGRSWKVSSAVSRYKGPTYKSSYWKTGMAASTLWGYSSYRRRRLYTDHPDREPTVCFNAVKPKSGQFAYFICPEPGQSDSYTYCCGEDGDQTCCTFWGDGGRVVGVVIGIIVGVSLLILGFVFLVCILFKRLRKRNRHDAKIARQQNQTLDSAAPLTKMENDYIDSPHKEDRELRPIYNPRRNHGNRERNHGDEYRNHDEDYRIHSNEPRSHRSEYRSHPSDRHNYENEPRDFPSKGHGHLDGYKVDLPPPQTDHEPGYEPVMYGFRADVYNNPYRTDRQGYQPSSRQPESPPPPYSVDI